MFAYLVVGLLVFGFCEASTNDVQRMTFVAYPDQVAEGFVPGIAQATFSWEQGWYLFSVSSNDSYSFEDQLYAAGFLEGRLSETLIRDHIVNVLASLLANGTTEVPEGLSNFLIEQHGWIERQAQQRSSSSRYWKYVGGLVAQVQGLVAGAHLTLGEAMFAVSGGDVPAILSKLEPAFIPNYDHLTPEQVELEVAKRTRCSALIRVTPGLDDLYSSHSTWWNMGTMLRVFKTFNLPIPSAANISETERVRQAFSSYPGVLSSQDDYYMTSRGMVLVQTTNTVYNASLYQLVEKESLLSWHRVRLANELSTSGDEWAELFKKHASGTYPNQYMLVDYSRFVPGQPLAKGLLTVVEEIPGLIIARDQTKMLADGYWPSYNIPFYDEVYQMSGNADFAAKHGLDYSYELSPRAVIFRRDAPKVTDYEAFKTLMRSNNYLTDPASKGNPLKAICGRGDLLHPPEPHGCIDSKSTNYQLVATLQSDAICGPPQGSNNRQYPPFDWDEDHGALMYQSHLGQPKVFDFVYIRTPSPPS